MKQELLAGVLAELTGSLSPGVGSTEEELDRARRLLAGALAAGQSAKSIRSDGPGAAPQAVAGQPLAELAPDLQRRLTAIARMSARRTPPASVTTASPAMVQLRTTPFRNSLDPSLPDWTRGMAVATSLGPFVGATGLPVWLDLFNPLRQLRLVRGPGNDVVAVLPIRAGRLPFKLQTHFALGSGSVWVAAPKLAAASPPGSFAGFRIKGGTLDLDMPARVQGGVLRMPAGATCTLAVDTDPPAAPGPVAGPGVDVGAMAVTLPAKVSIRFKPAGGEVTGLSSFSVDVYGTAVTCAEATTPATYEPLTRELLVPATANPNSFGAATPQSTLFNPAGAAPIKSAAWALPVAMAAPAQLGPAEGAGAVRLALGSGLQISWKGSGPAVALSSVVLEATPVKLAVLGTPSTSVLAQELKLWDEAPVAGAPRRSSLGFRSGKGTPVLYFSQPGLEAVIASGSAVAHVDRPLRADGTRFSVRAETAVLAVYQDPAGIHALLVGTSSPTQPLPLAMALQNALFKVLPPEHVGLVGGLDAAGVVTGTFGLSFPLLGLLPTLPDPYAANFPTPTTAEDIRRGWLNSSVAWTEPAKPALSFSLKLISNLQPATSLAVQVAHRRELFGLALLDVSGNADQLGVATMGPGFDLAISDSQLAMTGSNLAVFALPSMSWEPIYTDHPEPPAPPEPPPNRMGPDFTTDGVPTVVRVPTVALAPMDPTPLLTAYIRGREQGLPYQALFNLPFGLIAGLDVPAYRRRDGIPLVLDRPGLMVLNQPKFSHGLRGGIQLTLTPPFSLIVPAGAPDPVFPGFTAVTTYAAEIMGFDVTKIFTPSFLNSVPLARIDLSGYGASTFSEWQQPVKKTGVKKVQFETLVGRTRYEVIQVKSTIFPWHIPVVRTITIERQAAGWVHRQDSGWQAVAPGDLDLSDLGVISQKGAIDGVFNVRNIADVGGLISSKTTPSIDYRQVVFDGDFKIAQDPAAPLNVRSGGFPGQGGTLLASQGVVGYLQLTPDLVPPAPPIPGPKLLAALADVIGQSPVGGPVLASVQIGDSGPVLRISRIDATLNQDQVLVAALRGTPALPATGSWTVGRQTGTQAPVALDPHQPVPLVRSTSVDPQHWHLADPSEIGRLTAQQDSYGLLQATGTQRSFFASPRVNALAPGEFDIQKQPHLADVGALLNSTGAFADIASTLGFKPGQNLKLDGDGLAVHRDVDFAGVPAKPLIDFGAVKILLAYDARPFDNKAQAPKAALDIKKDGWSVDIQNVALVLVTPYGDEKAPILWLVGDLHADQGTAPTFSNLTVRYGGKLDPVQNVFSKLSELAKNLPGGAAAGIDVHFSAGRLTVREVFALPKLPLGLGQVTDVALDLGMTLGLAPKSLEFTAGIGSQEKPFHWLVSPLSGTGAVEVGVRDGDPTIMIEGGLGVGLSIDVGIASGAASVVIALQVDNKTGVFIIRAILVANASVDVLGGLVSASLTMSAALGLVPDFPFPPPPIMTQITLLAAVGVGIHLTVGWLVHVDFDGYWQFTQTLKSPITL